MSYYSSSSSRRSYYEHDSYYDRGERSQRDRRDPQESHYYERGQREHRSQTRDQIDRRDPPMFFTYMDNEFNKYVGKRVRIIIKYRGGRQREYIGTLMAFDLHTNIALADFYQVINYHGDFQRKDIEGLMIIRGSQVVSVKREREEKKLKSYPTPREESKRKAAKDSHKSKTTGTAAGDAVPAVTPDKVSRPLKLKRTWKAATPEPTPTSVPKHPTTPQTPILLDTPVGTPSAVVSEMVRELTIKEEPQEEHQEEQQEEKQEEQQEVKQEEQQEEKQEEQQEAGISEVVVKQEQVEEELEDYETVVEGTVKEEHNMTFEEFINTSDLQEESENEGEKVD